MNNRQRLVQQQYLNNEKAVIDRLEQVYKKALQDIDSEIERLMERFDPETGDLPQSVIYQVQYQRQLRSQIEGHLSRLRSQQYTTVAGYLDDCYTDGFVGTMYDMHGQGVPLLMPIDQESMIRAVQLDSKISKGLYTRLGEDIDLLKRKITAQVSRGISTGMSYAQVAQQLAGYTRIGFNNAVRIARTEGHRIQTTAAMDAMHGAKEKGADIVKQWDATLDDRTRESHMMVDGQIRELDEPFGNGLLFPGDPNGGAAEVVNCRCAILQRARWALGEKMDPETGEVIWQDGQFTKFDRDSGQLAEFKDSDDYETFKQKYLKAVEEPAPVVETPAPTVIATAEEAEKAMRSIFHLVGGGISGMPEDQLVTTARRLQELESRFGCAKAGDYTFEVVDLGGRDKDTFAYVRNRETTGNNLVLNARYFGESVDSLVEVEAQQMAMHWMMPCAPQQLMHYTVTHEYGHMVEHMIIRNRLDRDALERAVQARVDSYIRNGLSVSQWQVDNFRKGYEQRAIEELEKTIWGEIRAIAKEVNPAFTVKANISGYGKTNFVEAFAESFANAHCGEPNELGNAMIIWLERQGY